MDGILKYKGYVGSINYDWIDQTYYGKIQGIQELISYEGKNLYLLKSNFQQAVDEYEEKVYAMQNSY